MTTVQIVEQILEELEEYAHNVQSPELLLSVLRTAWLLHEERIQSSTEGSFSRSKNEELCSNSGKTEKQLKCCQTRRARLES